MAAETPLKRQRDETEPENEEDPKRQKQPPPPSYTDILSLLEEEEDEPTQDLSSLITTLQQELDPTTTTTTTSTATTTNNENPTTVSIEDYTSSSTTPSSSCSSTSLFGLGEEEEEGEEEGVGGDRERVMRHLLEASDDELGIPNREEDMAVNVGGGDNNYDNGLKEDDFLLVNSDSSGDGSVDVVDCFNDGLWEFEDVNANYYTMLQSELFM